MNRNSIEKAADKFIRQGKLEPAIKQLLKLVALNPRDVTTINRVGDLYAKLGKKQEAIRHFGQIAEHYREEGFLLKAIAIYKKITKLEPLSLDAYSCLAGLYSRQGLTMEARAQYQFVADQCLKSGRDEQGLEVLREMEGLYPHDVPLRLSIAQTLDRLQRDGEALEMYRAVGVEFDRKGMHQESRKVYEAALLLAPGETSLVRQLVTSLICQEEPAPAIELLNSLLVERPEDPELLSMLGDSHLDSGAAPRAMEIYAQVKELAPASIENLMNDARVCLKDGDLDGGFVHLDDAMQHSGGPEIARRLIPHVQRLLDLEPHHLPGLAALSRLYESAGDEGSCRDAYIRLAGASLEKEQLQTATSALRHLIRLDPKNPRHEERLDKVLLKLRSQGEAIDEVESAAAAPVQAEESAGATGAAQNSAAAGVESFGEQEVLESRGEPLDQDFIAEHMTEAEVFVKYGLTDKAIHQLRAVVERYPHLLSAREALLEIYTEEGQREAAVKECGWIARILREEGDVQGAARALAEAEELLPGGLPAEVEAAEAVLGEDTTSRVSVEVVELAEDDGYQEEDLDEEDLEIEAAVPEALPQAEPLQPMEESSPALELKASRDVQETLTEEVGGFDLAAELDPELFQPQLAIEDPGDLSEGHAIRGVVAAFRQGIAEQVSEEDFETHYNLAIAYKEMGLVDEAIGEFQFASKSGEFFTRCCSMLGICFREKGMGDLAIQWYGRGLEKAEQTEDADATLGLRYDLASLYEDKGDRQRALEILTVVYGVDASYRDVPARIRGLRQSLGQS